ncbi:restriction endonuclease subunit S [Streptomyces sp. NBC_00820]|uniref:restriction endonuclease subunit S n=1 Tax=Streptomyces sp. NBC_00820 TaxID=2975842 RepID=UPI002ED660B4|nr:restriction endonuclease subunit S [Streptomyces sp. NBC_00820]
MSWDETRLKHLCTDSGQYGLNVPADQYRSSGTRLIRTSDITANGELRNAHDGVFVDTVLEPRHQLRQGDILLSRSGTLGRSLLVPAAADGHSFAGFLIRFRPSGDTEPRFLKYATQSAPFQGVVHSEAVSSTIQNFNADRYANIPLRAPGTDEQRRIADFLDTEIARVDRLALARERQLALAFARLDALAVRETGRLHVRAAGEPPADWPVRPLRRAIRGIKTGSTPSGSGPELWTDGSQPDTLPWYGPSDFEGLLGLGVPARLLPSGAVAERVVPLFPKGSVLIVGIGATAGKVAYLDHDASGNQQITALTPERDVSGEFLAWQLWAAARELRSTAPYTTLPIINNDFLKSFLIAVPSLGRQQEVARRLNRAADHVGALRAAAVRASGLVRERRQALITAAVTGQFDVSTAGGRNVTDGVTA